MQVVLRVSPAPIGRRRRAALADRLGGDIDVVQCPGGSFDDIVAAATAHAVDVIALDCVRDVDPSAVATATGVTVLRPEFTSVRNHRGEAESVFAGYNDVAAYVA